MRFWLSILVVCTLAAVCSAAEKPHAPSQPSPAKSSPKKTSVSKKDRQAAEKEFRRAMELQKTGQLGDALQAVSRAMELFPGNPEYVVAHEMLRQQMVGGYLDRGNRLAQAGDNRGAAEQFRAALHIDPQNTYTQQRLRDVSPPEDADRRHNMELLASVDDIQLAPTAGTRSFHVRGDTRSVYTQIGQAFGVSFRFDDSLSSRALRFDIEDVDFYAATALAGKMSKTFWAPLTSQDAIVASDTPEMRRQWERLSLRTFYLGGATAPTDVNDIVNLMRTIFEMRFVSAEPSRNTITVRAPKEAVEAAAALIDNLMDARPEVMLDLQVLEYDTDKTRQYGLSLPNTFTVFNVPSEIRRVLGADAQPIIDQLNKTGTIDPSTIPAGDLANLQSSPLLSPLLFFGSGLGLTAVAVPPINATLAFNSSYAGRVEHATLRAVDGETATFRLGDRFPILTGTFSSLGVDAQGNPVAANSPQFQYYDLGLTLKAKPHYHSDGDVKLDIELDIVGLGTTAVNGIPVLTTRSFKGNITARDGEPSVVAGEIDEQELRSTSGYPGIGQVPVIQGFTNTNFNPQNRVHNQIVIVVKPHVVRKPFRDKGASVFWNPGS
jgi:general secretion pathway protein D